MIKNELISLEYDKNILYELLKITYTNGEDTYVHLLIKNKINVHLKDTNIIDIKNADGMTPLIYSCYMNFSTFAEHLLRIGANKKAKDNYGNTYAYYAAKNKMLMFTRLENTPNKFGLKPSDICSYYFESVYI